MSIFRNIQYLDSGFRNPFGVISLFLLFLNGFVILPQKCIQVLFMTYFFLVAIIYYNIYSVQIGKKPKMIKAQSI